MLFNDYIMWTGARVEKGTRNRGGNFNAAKNGVPTFRKSWNGQRIQIVPRVAFAGPE